MAKHYDFHRQRVSSEQHRTINIILAFTRSDKTGGESVLFKWFAHTTLIDSVNCSLLMVEIHSKLTTLIVGYHFDVKSIKVQIRSKSSYLLSVRKRKMTLKLLFCILLMSDINQVPGVLAQGNLDREAVGNLSSAINNAIQALREGALADDVIQAFTNVREQAKQILLAAGVNTTQNSTEEKHLQGDDIRVVLFALEKKFNQLHSLGGNLFQLKDQAANDQAIVEVLIRVEETAKAIVTDVKALGGEMISYQPEIKEYTKVFDPALRT